MRVALIFVLVQVLAAAGCDSCAERKRKLSSLQSEAAKVLVGQSQAVLAEVTLVPLVDLHPGLTGHPLAVELNRLFQPARVDTIHGGQGLQPGAVILLCRDRLAQRPAQDFVEPLLGVRPIGTRALVVLEAGVDTPQADLQVAVWRQQLGAAGVPPERRSLWRLTPAQAGPLAWTHPWAAALRQRDQRDLTVAELTADYLPAAAIPPGGAQRDKVIAVIANSLATTAYDEIIGELQILTAVVAGRREPPRAGYRRSIIALIAGLTDRL